MAIDPNKFSNMELGQTKEEITPFEAFKDLLPPIESTYKDRRTRGASEGIVVVQRKHLKRVKDLDEKDKRKKALYMKAMVLRLELQQASNEGT